MTALDYNLYGYADILNLTPSLAIPIFHQPRGANGIFIQQVGPNNTVNGFLQISSDSSMIIRVDDNITISVGDDPLYILLAKTGERMIGTLTQLTEKFANLARDKKTPAMLRVQLSLLIGDERAYQESCLSAYLHLKKVDSNFSIKWRNDRVVGAAIENAILRVSDDKRVFAILSGSGKRLIAKIFGNVLETENLIRSAVATELGRNKVFWARLGVESVSSTFVLIGSTAGHLKDRSTRRGRHAATRDSEVVRWLLFDCRPRLRGPMARWWGRDGGRLDKVAYDPVSRKLKVSMKAEGKSNLFRRYAVDTRSIKTFESALSQAKDRYLATTGDIVCAISWEFGDGDNDRGFSNAVSLVRKTFGKGSPIIGILEGKYKGREFVRDLSASKRFQQVRKEMSIVFSPLEGHEGGFGYAEETYSDFAGSENWFGDFLRDDSDHLWQLCRMQRGDHISLKYFASGSSRALRHGLVLNRARIVEGMSAACNRACGIDNFLLGVERGYVRLEAKGLTPKNRTEIGEILLKGGRQIFGPDSEIAVHMVEERETQNAMISVAAYGSQLSIRYGFDKIDYVKERLIANGWRQQPFENLIPDRERGRFHCVDVVGHFKHLSAETQMVVVAIWHRRHDLQFAMEELAAAMTRRDVSAGLLICSGPVPARPTAKVRGARIHVRNLFDIANFRRM